VIATQPLIITQFSPEVDPQVVAALQAIAQNLFQLTQAVNSITFATDPTGIVNGGQAGNFNGCFLTGTIANANSKTTFNHQLGRQPVGALEVLALPQAQQTSPPVAQVVCPIGVFSFTGNQVVLESTSANRQFTLILL
jgi:hypothetical protein